MWPCQARSEDNFHPGMCGVVAAPPKRELGNANLVDCCDQWIICHPSLGRAASGCCSLLILEPLRDDSKRKPCQCCAFLDALTFPLYIQRICLCPHSVPDR